MRCPQRRKPPTSHPTPRFAQPPLPVALAVLLVAAARSHAQHSVPRPDHVVIVMEENRAYGDIIGSGAAPYINRLAREGALFTSSFALTHPSQPNYLALFAGSTFGVDDSCPVDFRGPNLASRLRAAGETFAGYSESLPFAGYAGCDAGGYRRKHNPWASFGNVPPSANRPLTSFPADFTRLPTVSWVVPNEDNDMHDGSVEQGDAWLRRHLDPYVRWAMTHNSLFVLTWDEDDKSGNNHIVTILVGPMVRPGHYCEYVTHYTVLRTVLEMYGLAPVGASARADPITSCWTPESVSSPLSLALTSPEDGAVFHAGDPMDLAVDVASSDSTIRKVSFFRGV